MPYTVLTAQTRDATMARQRNVEENYAASWLIPVFDFDSADCALWCQPSLDGSTEMPRREIINSCRLIMMTMKKRNSQTKEAQVSVAPRQQSTINCVRKTSGSNSSVYFICFYSNTTPKFYFAGTFIPKRDAPESPRLIIKRDNRDRNNAFLFLLTQSTCDQFVIAAQN